VLYDRLVHHSLLALAPESAELIDVGKRPEGPDRQGEINRLLVEHGRRRHTVVRLKGGDPFVFGRGGEEAEALTSAGVQWEVVPGVSSAFAVPAAVGIPVTHRGVSSSVTVVTGTGSVDWEVLAQMEGTLVILMGMSNRAAIADALQRGGKAASTPVAVIERGTTSSQVVVRTSLGELADVPLGPPAVIVVGDVAALGRDGRDGRDVRPLAGRSVVLTRSGPRAQGLRVALRHAGASVVEVPLTTQTDPDDGGAALRAAAREVGSFRWVVLTSVNAVSRLMGELRDARAVGATLVAAVGPATADALRAAGIEPDLMPADHRAEGLIAAFPAHEPGSSGNSVLFPSADRAPSTIPEGLAKKGWEVHRVEAYRTVALPPPDGPTLERIALADAVILTAPSSADVFAGLKAHGGAPLRLPPLVVCIGPTTAERARALGLARVEQAVETSSEAIVEVLIGHLCGPGTPGS
jgi:uroporphyrinogen III methyltransferase/synthase